MHAYKSVLRSYGLDSNPGSETEEVGSDLEVMDEVSLLMKKIQNRIFCFMD